MRLNPFCILCLAGMAWTGNAFAVSSEFTYQGTLEDGGQSANGVYDLVFNLKSETGASLFSPILFDNVPVVGGVFTVTLDFGPAAFPGANRSLRIGVRPGDSAGQYTTLAPDVLLTAAPYAQFANESDFAQSANFASTAFTASSADDVIANAIDESDINTGAVSSRNIQDGAVTATDIAANTLTLSRFQGVSGNYALSVTIAANDCADFDVTFGGDVNQGDVPIITIQPGFQLPDSMSITALRVFADNQVEIRVCNEVGIQQSFSNLGIRLTTLR